MTNDNKLDPKEKADAIGILCGSNFDSVVQLLTRCSSLIHDLNANSYIMKKKYAKNGTMIMRKIAIMCRMNFIML